MTNPTVNFASGWLDVDPSIPARIAADLKYDGPENRGGGYAPARVGFRLYSGVGGTTLAEETFFPTELSGGTWLWKMLDRFLTQSQQAAVTRAELIFLNRGAKQPPAVTSLAGRPAPVNSANAGLLAGLNAFAGTVSRSLAPDGQAWAAGQWAVLELPT